MEDSRTAHSVPEGFNPWITLDAIRGLADAIHHVLLEGPGAEDRMAYGDRAALDGLAGLMRDRARALHDYFTRVGDITTVKLPLSEEDFDALHVRHARTDEVKEEPALYLVR